MEHLGCLVYLERDTFVFFAYETQVNVDSRFFLMATLCQPNTFGCGQMTNLGAQESRRDLFTSAEEPADALCQAQQWEDVQALEARFLALL